MGGFGKAPARGFAQYTLGEFGSRGAGIQGGRAFDGGRIRDRSGVPRGLTLCIPRFRGPHGNHLGLAGFGGTVRLFASAARYFSLAHWHTGTIHPEIHGGSHFADSFHATAFVNGNLGAECLGGPLDLTGTHFYSRQFVQQGAALFKAHQGRRTAGHS